MTVFPVEPPEIVPFTFGDDTVDEGEFAQLTCAVRRGDRLISITWSLKGDVISSEPAMTTTMISHQASMLIISSVGYRHSGNYTCNAESPAGIRHQTVELKVK